MLFYMPLYVSSQSHEELESFCFNLDSLLSNINDQHPPCSIEKRILMQNV